MGRINLQWNDPYSKQDHEIFQKMYLKNDDANKLINDIIKFVLGK